MTRCELRGGAGRCLALAVASFLAMPVTPGAAQERRSVPQMLRLRDAIAIALESSNNIGIQQEQLDQARKVRTGAWFELGPDLRASGSWSKSTRKDYNVTSESASQIGHLVTIEGDTLAAAVATTTQTADVTEKSSAKNGQVSSTIRLFDGFANYKRIAAAGSDVKTQEHSLEYTRQQVQETAIENFFNLLRAKLLLRVAEESERVARDQLDRTKALYDLGSAARSDVLKSQVQHDQTRLDLVKVQQAERQAHVDLEWAMNLGTSTPFDIDTTIVSKIDYKTTDYDSVRAYALEHRENLLSFRNNEKAAGDRVWVARGTLWPTLDFQYSLSRTRTTSQFRFGGAENFNREWALFSSWNIWDRYQNYVQIDQAKANARIAEYNRRQAELDAMQEIQRLVNTMDEARERLSVSRESVVSAREDLRLAQEKFRVGAGTILDTVVAEQGLTQAQANEVQAIVDYLIARAKLARATGRPLSEV